MSEKRGSGLQIDLFAALPEPAATLAQPDLAPDLAPAVVPVAAAAAEPAPARGKEPGAMRTIGEVAEALAIRPHVLRYWEEQFPMLRPVKRSGARRYYRPEDVRLVEVIDRLVHREGYTLRGARQWLEAEAKQARKTRSGADKAAVAPQGAGKDRLATLQAIRATLAIALGQG